VFGSPPEATNLYYLDFADPEVLSQMASIVEESNKWDS
jgi:hypothetical protein